MASAESRVNQSLECCLCYELFTQPKLLTCGHTFCKECLVHLYECHPQQNQIYCPICRQITNINDGDIAKLQTNILINSMVEDVNSSIKSCTICDLEAKSPAVQYCAQCEEYMCDPCTVAHGKCEKTAKHDVVSMDEVKKGKVDVSRFCTKHPEKEKLYVCTSCNVSICFTCRGIDHDNPDHNIKEVCDYKKTLQKQIKSLLTKATTKLATIEVHTDLVKKQKAVVEVELDLRIAEINQSYEKEAEHLTRQRNDLIDRCEQEKASQIAHLEKIKDSNDKTMSCIRSASELVGNGLKTKLQGETLVVHNRICCDLEKMLDESHPDSTQPKSIADLVKQLKFIMPTTPNILGQLRTAVPPIWKAHSMYFCITFILLPLCFACFLFDFSQNSEYQLVEVSTFPLSPPALPWDAMPLSDGQVVVSYNGEHGLEMFTVDGPQETVLKGLMVLDVSALSDGRYVIGTNNEIILYTHAWERLNVQFKYYTLSYYDRGFGGICVDRDDNIYIGHANNKKILAFRPEGSFPFREILCHDPREIWHMHHSKRLVVCDWLTSVKVIDDIDGESTAHHHIPLDCQSTRVAILKDDSILIGCRKADLLSIELYTKDLEKVGTVLGDFPMTHDIRKLLELPTGAIVVVSEKQFIVFQKI